ncbi:hypothetical protein N431DRAFT_453874 [Stipitochalara longipes BDJ]|nr:hypothetical protein N431DRAFT_453874 [Stipitochalara longipes BDJ]
MALLGIFQCFRKSPTSHNNDTAPPPYGFDSGPSKKPPKQTKEMKHFKNLASQAPQWLWSTYECRQWLKAVCIVYFNLTLKEAEVAAAKFDGYGPTLFMKKEAKWTYMLGQNGRGLYAMILGYRWAKGAFPLGMKLGHGDRQSV